MKSSKNFFYGVSIILPLIIIGCCFLPWVHYNSINVTFNGFNVTQFTTGVYYGKAGIPITVMSSVIFLLALSKWKNAAQFALFLSAVLFAYGMRTFILFTGSLFEGQVQNFPGIYLVAWLPLLLVLSFIFRRNKA